MPGPGCTWRYAIAPGGKSTRSQRMTHCRAAVDRHVGGELRAGAAVLRQLPDERVPVGRCGPETRLPGGELVDDAMAGQRIDAVAVLVEGEDHRGHRLARRGPDEIRPLQPVVEILASVDHDRLIAGPLLRVQWKYCPPSITIV